MLLKVKLKGHGTKAKRAEDMERRGREKKR